VERKHNRPPQTKAPQGTGPALAWFTLPAALALKGIRALIGLLGLALALAACSGPDKGARLARSAATFVSLADPALRAAYEGEQRACLASGDREGQAACVATVRARWEPVRAALGQVRAAWCDLDPDACRVPRE